MIKSVILMAVGLLIFGGGLVNISKPAFAIFFCFCITVGVLLGAITFFDQIGWIK